MQTDKLNFGEGKIASLYDLDCVAVYCVKYDDSVCHECVTQAAEQFAEMRWPVELASY